MTEATPASVLACVLDVLAEDPDDRAKDLALEVAGIADDNEIPMAELDADDSLVALGLAKRLDGRVFYAGKDY